MTETWRDVTRRALESRGYLYFGDILDEVRARLSRADRRVGTAMAAASAGRLMAAHRSLPGSEQSPFTIAWDATLRRVWDALDADQPEPAVADVRRALDAFHVSPRGQAQGREGAHEADEDAAAAAIYAAESLCGSEEAAFWAISRLLDRAFHVAEADVELPGPHVGTVERFIQEAAHPAVQSELRRLLEGLALLESRGTARAVLEELRERFAVG